MRQGKTVVGQIGKVSIAKQKNYQQRKTNRQKSHVTYKMGGPKSGKVSGWFGRLVHQWKGEDL